jgi:hypothetical protein
MTFIPSFPQPSSQRRDERSGTWLKHADEIHCTTPAHPLGMLAVPEAEPHWDYPTNDLTSRDEKVTCLVAGLKRAAQNVVNFDKLREVQQEEKKIQPVSCPDLQRHYNV